MVLDAIAHAIWTRQRVGIEDLAGLIHHNDRASQPDPPQRPCQPIQVGGVHRPIDRSRHRRPIGAIGNSYDNALAETINGLYKTELIKAQGPWRIVDQVEVATLEWVDWFNHRRLYEYCGDMPPAECEALYYRHHRTQHTAEFSNPKVPGHAGAVQQISWSRSQGTRQYDRQVRTLYC